MAITPIEKIKLENTDLQQIEYLSDLDLSKKDVLVIEPNNTISMTIRKFLVNLNFENIHVCTKVDEGVKVFTHFIENDANVPIILDSDTYKNIINTVSEILEIQPNAHIVILTTKDKKDSQVVKLINMGISSIAQKPLKFDEFKKSFSFVLEKEKEVEKTETKENLILQLLASNKISQNKITHILKKDMVEIERLLENLIGENKIILDEEILEATCNQCNSTNITYVSACPNCKGSNFKQIGLIEHYSCGESYPKEGNWRICPKCNKEIGNVGSDYREFSDYYTCSSCNDRFPKPTTKFVCLDCNNEFIEKLASWNKSKIYKIQK